MNIINWEPYRPFTVGFDSILDRLMDIKTESPNYPPYNIKKLDALHYVVEMAVAGFGKEDINVEYADNTMTVQSVKKEKTEDKNVVHQGISQRSFIRSFALGDDMIVTDANLKNGLLSIYNEKIVPEEKKPKTIDIK